VSTEHAIEEMSGAPMTHPLHLAPGLQALEDRQRVLVGPVPRLNVAAHGVAGSGDDNCTLIERPWVSTRQTPWWPARPCPALCARRPP